MGRRDWYRRTSWTPKDEAEFQSRLKRSRGDFHKAQYLRIQAYCLAQAKNHAAALSLLDQLFRECPDPFSLAQARDQRAESLLALGRADEAIAEYRAGLQAQRDEPTVQTQAALDLAWLIVDRRLEHMYDEALSLVEQFCSERPHAFPIQRFHADTFRAVIADEKGDRHLAKKWAESALKAAHETHSGFPRHPDFGVVGEVDPALQAKLIAIRDRAAGA